MALLYSSGYSQIFHWAARGGGAGNAYGFSCVTDAAGNAYTTGMFNGPGTFSSMNVSVGGDCFFLTKHNQQSIIRWTKAGVSASSFCSNVTSHSMTIDQQANVYILGSFTGSMLIGNNLLNTTSSCETDIFIAKYDSSGALVWTRQLEGNGSQNYPGSICYDNAGHIYVSGLTGSDSLDAGNGQLIYNTSSAGGSKLFLAKLDTAGLCQWARIGIGGTSITADAAGNIWATGSFMGSLTQGAYTIAASGVSDENIFVAKYDGSGNVLFLQGAGGPYSDEGNDIVTDAAGNAYVTGFFLFDAQFGSHSVISSGMYDVFVAKYDASGNVIWVSTAGGAEQDYGSSIEIDASGRLFITGTYNDAIAFGTSALQACNALWPDMFIAKLDTAGNFNWGKTAGGPGIEEIWGLATGTAGDVFVAGAFENTAAFGAVSITSTGGTLNMFLTRLAFEDAPLYNSVSEYESGDVSIYPNPAHDHFYIKIRVNGISEDRSFEILDVCGRIVMKDIIAGYDVKIDVSKLAKGTYFVKVNSGNGCALKKLVVH
jgi:hypothetical protein